MTNYNPTVSVIVPARNEEACLASCLESLVVQTGVEFEIIVVDDASTDRTNEIARSFDSRSGDAAPAAPSVGTAIEDLPAHAGRVSVIVITAPPLPENWTGKNNAMAAGAKVAGGKWLLFTDADTVHKPGSLARAVAEAEAHGAALLSYSPEQEVCTFWEKAVMPVIFAELAATYPPKKVNDPTSPIAAANGQYLLISRETYDAVGGHSKVASDLLEDVAMAHLVKSSGRKLFFRYGGDAVRTRMYRNWEQMKEGWTKNLALLFPKPGELAMVQVGVLVAFIGTALSTVSKLLSGTMPDFWPHWFWPEWSWRQGLGIPNASAFLLITGYLCIRTRKGHFPWVSAFLSPLGLALFSYLLFRSKYFYGKGRLDWRDRTYIYSPEEMLLLKKGRRAPEAKRRWIL